MSNWKEAFFNSPSVSLCLPQQPANVRFHVVLSGTTLNPTVCPPYFNWSKKLPHFFFFIFVKSSQTIHYHQYFYIRINAWFEITIYSRKAFQNNFQMGVHAIGDRANKPNQVDWANINPGWSDFDSINAVSGQGLNVRWRKWNLI